MRIVELLKDSKVQVAIVIIVFLISILNTRNNDIKNQDLKSQNNFTIGRITDSYSTGAEYGTQYIEYSYSVDKKDYIKSVNYIEKFLGCNRSRNCIGRKFVVYYDKNNPEKSFMDFDEEKYERKLNIP